MINLHEVGAHALTISEHGIEVQFGIYLPDIHAKDGYEVHVLVLPKADHFNAEITPRQYTLQQVDGSENNLWQGRFQIKPEEGTHFGQPGTYLYRYQLFQDVGEETKKIIVRWFTDPFALATDIGLLSAFTTPDYIPEFNWTDEGWKVPEVDDLIVYELNVEEFNSTFAGVIERLPYLQGLGVNCLEIMPITSLKLNFDWGYGPLHYFAPYERWGGVQGLKQLVNACHEAGIAVILDVVYQHVDPDYPYNLVYKKIGIESPMIGGDGPFGPEIDFNKDFARDYIKAANAHWLYEYHVDGFRYDEVTDLYDGPTGIQYARIAYDTYKESLKITRFTPDNQDHQYSRLIQCSEAQNRPQEVLRTTFTNTTWQDGLLVQAQDMAQNGHVNDTFGLQVILDGSFADYPATKEVEDIHGNPVEMPVTPFQYLENHDHSRLISFISTLEGDLPSGDRSLFYKLQPFAIALYTCQGVPMLWQGQEFAQNYVLPQSGKSRVGLRRDVSWEYFYDEVGEALVRLYRRLGKLRRDYAALRSRESFYYHDESKLEDGIISYRRHSSQSEQIAIVCLNFSDEQRSITLPFPEIGTYYEMLDDDHRQERLEVQVHEQNQHITIEVPGHYGQIYIKSKKNS